MAKGRGKRYPREVRAAQYEISNMAVLAAEAWDEAERGGFWYRCSDQKEGFERAITRARAACQTRIRTEAPLFKCHNLVESLEEQLKRLRRCTSGEADKREKRTRWRTSGVRRRKRR